MEGEFSFSNSGNEFPPISCCLNKFLCIVNFFPSLLSLPPFQLPLNGNVQRKVGTKRVPFST